jgi:carbon monoxide dehydrogenase subunit G
MIKLERSVLIERPVEDVYSFISNFENESKWCEEVVRTQKTSEGPIGVGSTFTDHVEFMGRTIKSSYEILACEPNKSITIETSAGLVPFVATYSFDDADGVTKLAILAEAEPGGVFKHSTPIIRRRLDKQWEQNFANLKQLLES